MKYYKVVNSINSAVNINTQTTNYGKTLIYTEHHKSFLNFIVSSSQRLDLPFDFFIMLNNNLAFSGNQYLSQLPNKQTYNLTTFVKNPSCKNYSKYSIHFHDLKYIIESIDQIGIEFFQEGFYLWEYLYELERTNIDSPKRSDSFFLFDNIKDCEYYINKHKGGGQICEVELKDTKKLFRADMSLLDSIENHYTFSESKNIIQKYWNQQESDKPVFEYLFEGECVLKPIKHINRD